MLLNGNVGRELFKRRCVPWRTRVAGPLGWAAGGAGPGGAGRRWPGWGRTLGGPGWEAAGKPGSGSQEWCLGTERHCLTDTGWEAEVLTLGVFFTTCLLYK